MSQVELASRAGVTQSLPTLAALIEAAGYQLEVSVQEPAGNLGRLTGPVGRRVRRHRAEMVAAGAHGVANLRVFGSVARSQDRADSDVDLLADIPAGMGLLGLGRVTEDLVAL